MNFCHVYLNPSTQATWRKDKSFQHGILVVEKNRLLQHELLILQKSDRDSLRIKKKLTLNLDCTTTFQYVGGKITTTKHRISLWLSSEKHKKHMKEIIYPNRKRLEKLKAAQGKFILVSRSSRSYTLIILIMKSVLNCIDNFIYTRLKSSIIIIE